MIDYTGTIVIRESDGKCFEIVGHVEREGRRTDDAWTAVATSPKFPSTITITSREIGVRRTFGIAVPNEGLLARVVTIPERARRHGRTQARTARGNIVTIVFEVRDGLDRFRVFTASDVNIANFDTPEACARRLATWGATEW